MEALLQLMKNAGAAHAGAVALPALLPRMSPLSRRRAMDELPRAGSLLVGVFPYFTDFLPGTIALYARGIDYHRVLGDRLSHAARHMEQAMPGHCFRVYVDASPYPEVQAAALAGLGVIGRHGLLIAPESGSLVFIGIIATTLTFESRPMPRFCQNCGRCLRACPTGALGESGLNPARCLSHLTQLKGALTKEQETAIAKNGMVWGCDVCQKACPMNRDMPVTHIHEFKGDILRVFPPEDGALSQRAFREKYGDRAFAWRGIGPLRRNIRILAEYGRNG